MTDDEVWREERPGGSAKTETDQALLTRLSVRPGDWLLVGERVGPLWWFRAPEAGALVRLKVEVEYQQENVGGFRSNVWARLRPLADTRAEVAP